MNQHAGQEILPAGENDIVYASSTDNAGNRIESSRGTSIESVSYKVKYLEKETNKVLANEVTKENIEKNSVQTEIAVNVTGYTPEEENKEITVDEDGKELIFYYTANKYIVRFNANFEGAINATKDQQMVYDKDGRKTKLEKNTFEREEYTFIKWNVNADGTGKGYDDEEEVSNLTSENGKIINLYAQWKKKEVTKPEPKPETEIGKVIVKYEDINGKKLAENKTLSGEVGKDYKTEKIEISGYEFKEVEGKEEGKFAKEEQTVIYKYKKIEETKPEPKPQAEIGKVIAKYQDENGNQIKDDITLEGEVGKDYKTEKAEFEIYEFVEVEGKEEGKFEKEEQVVIYKYNKKSGRVIIIYNDPDGVKIKENDVITGKIDSDYKVKRQVVDGYELVEVIGNEEGKYTLADQFVLYKYKKIEKEVIVPQTGQSRIAYIIIGIIILCAIFGLIYIKWDDLKHKK